MSAKLIALKRDLSVQELEILKTELQRKKKSTGLVYALWFFLSYLGLHKFYTQSFEFGLHPYDGFKIRALVGPYLRFARKLWS